MEARAHLRNLKMAPRKVSVVVDLVRGRTVGAALNILQFTKRAAAKPVAKLIKSAMANAKDLSQGAVDIDRLLVESIWVDQAQTQRRFLPRAMGRATRVNKKTSHVQVVLVEGKK